MKLYSPERGLAERLVATALPSVTLACAVPPHLAGMRRWRELGKIRLRALQHRRLARDWLTLLNSHPAFSDYVRQCPRFLYKAFRPYCTHAITPEQRLEAIHAHYLFMFRRGLGDTVARASRGPVVLAEAAGRSGLPYQVQLRTIDRFDREGELVLQLAQDDKIVYTVAFTVAPRDGRPTLSIGCVQGGKTEDAREAIRLATRELHGIRPKQLMVTLARQLGHEYGCERMLLVSNRNRVIYKAIRHGRVLADYDQLWEELGAVRRADGDYELECGPLEAPDLEAIASKKRSEAKRRHALVSALAEGVCVALRARDARI